jgi:hypothetical protein
VSPALSPGLRTVYVSIREVWWKPMKRKNAGGQFLEYCIATQDTTTV